MIVIHTLISTRLQCQLSGLLQTGYDIINFKIMNHTLREVCFRRVFDRKFAGIVRFLLSFFFFFFYSPNPDVRYHEIKNYTVHKSCDFYKSGLHKTYRIYYIHIPVYHIDHFTKLTQSIHQKECQTFYRCWISKNVSQREYMLIYLYKFLQETYISDKSTVLCRFSEINQL